MVIAAVSVALRLAKLVGASCRRAQLYTMYLGVAENLA